MKARIALALTALALTSAGCTDVSGPDPAEQIYNAALQQWNSNGPASYDMVLKRQGSVSDPGIEVTLEVRDEVVTSRTFTATGDPVPSNQASLYPDVPGLFAIIRSAMDDDPFFLSVEYNAEFGYPVLVQLDLTASSASDDVIYTVTAFTPITE